MKDNTFKKMLIFILDEYYDRVGNDTCTDLDLRDLGLEGSELKAVQDAYHSYMCQTCGGYEDDFGKTPDYEHSSVQNFCLAGCLLEILKNGLGDDDDV